MRVELPDALVSVGVVDSREGQLPVSETEDGTRYVEPESDATARSLRESFERAHGGSESDGSSGTCQEVKGDGEVCGRDLPCPYHSEGDE